MEEPINSLVPLAVQYESLLSLLTSNLVVLNEEIYPRAGVPRSERMNKAIRAVLDQLRCWEEEVQFSHEHQSISAIDVLQNLDYAGSLCTDKLRMAFYRLANGLLKLRAMHDNLEDKFVLPSGLVLNSTRFADELLQCTLECEG